MDEFMVLPVVAKIIWRSAPCGYLVFNAFTLILFSSLVSFFKSSMQSFLLSSTAMMPCALGNRLRETFRPAISFSGSSKILR